MTITINNIDMMDYKRLVLCAALAASFSACSNDTLLDTEMQPDGKMELSLSSGIEVEQASTRGSLSQNTQFNQNALIDVFISENTNGTATTTYTQPLVAKATNASGTLAFKSGSGYTTDNPQYWPTSGNGVNIYAWYPQGKVGSNIAASSVTFTIPTTTEDTKTVSDQSSDITASDLMWGRPSSNPVSRTSTAVQLTFKHLLTKVRVVLEAGNGVAATELQNATIRLNDVFTSVTVTDLKDPTASGKLTTNTSAGAAKADYVYVLKNGDGTTNNVNSNVCVIPPQTLGSITVILKSGGVLTATVSDALVASTAYKYTLTVTNTALTVSSTIEAWGTETDKTGSAVYTD